MYVMLGAGYNLLLFLLLLPRYGMALKQCANFYNNIATEMIHSQKPMMLADALEFEKVGAYAWAACISTYQ